VPLSAPYEDGAGDSRAVGWLAHHYRGAAAGRECWRRSGRVVAGRSIYPGLRPRGSIDHIDRGRRLCDPFSQANGRGSIGLAQPGDERSLHGDDLWEEGVYKGLALVGDVDEQLSSIGGMWLTLDEAPSLEGV
jgi:hypothetical protein